jgi:hypothetical protein
VEVADYWNVNACGIDAARDLRNGRGRVLVVHRHADDLRAGARERDDLIGRAARVGGVRVGHRLDDDRVRRADGHAADPARHGRAAGPEDHGDVLGDIGAKINNGVVERNLGWYASRF